MYAYTVVHYFLRSIGIYTPQAASGTKTKRAAFSRQNYNTGPPAHLPPKEEPRAYPVGRRARATYVASFMQGGTLARCKFAQEG